MAKPYALTGHEFVAVLDKLPTKPQLFLEHKDSVGVMPPVAVCCGMMPYASKDGRTIDALVWPDAFMLVSKRVFAAMGGKID